MGATVNISDNGEFSRRLTALGELFDAKLSPARQALYFEALRDLPFEAIAGALNAAARGCKFFPRPVELREFAVGNSEDAAEKAWLAFRSALGRIGYMSSVVIQDAALAETITAMFGTWAAACAADLSPEMWASKRKEFGRIYSVMRGRRLENGRYLLGMAEAQNQHNAAWSRFVPVGRISLDGQVQSLSAHEAEIEREQLAANACEFSRLDASSILARLRSHNQEDRT